MTSEAVFILVKYISLKPTGVFILGGAWSFSGLTSKIPPLGSMKNFDPDVKNTTRRHQCENHLTRGIFDVDVKV